MNDNNSNSKRDEMEMLLGRCALLPEWVKERIQNGWNGYWENENGDEEKDGHLCLNG